MQPLYQQVKEYVTRQIASGAWLQGERVPSENELVRQLALSRMTVHRALRELTEAGMLDRVPGVGTFVSQARLNVPAMTVRDIAEEIESRGQRHRCQVVCHEKVPCEAPFVRLFRRSPGDFLYRHTVVHHTETVPLMLEDRWVNPAVAPDFLTMDPMQLTATRYLLAVAPLQRLQQTMEAIQVNEQTAGWLRIGVFDPVLLLRRRTWAMDQVASYAQLYYVGERFQFGESTDDLPLIRARFARGD